MSLIINDNELNKQSEELKSNLDYYNRLGKPVVDEFAQDLDTKVSQIKSYLAQIQEYKLNFDIPSLQRMCVDLSTTLYYTEERVEELDLLSDCANLRYKDRYNEAYLAKQGTTTVADKKYTIDQLKAHSDQEALSENLIKFIYSHATSVLKAKVEAGQELLKVLSKILSSEIASLQAFGVSGKYQK